MKKSEALKILGLAEGASDDAVKKAHRKLVVANHPDKFGQDAARRAEAEEKTKLINEARDVLLNGTWDPEYRTAGTHYGAPYYYNPHASGAPGATGQGGYATGTPGAGNPFDGFPFADEFVWTTWDAAGHRTTYTATGAHRTDAASSAGAQGNGTPRGYAANASDWVDPFSAFFDSIFFTPREPTLAERLAKAKAALRMDIQLIAMKLAILAACLIFGASATGLYLYTIVSIGQGIWKRLRFLSLVLLVPFAMLALIFTPSGDANVGVFGGVLFACAVGFDLRNVRLHRAYIKLIKSRMQDAA